MHFPPKNIELKPTNTRAFYSDPKKFLERAAEYFVNQNALDAPITVPGLCLYLGFASRSTLSAYGDRPGFEAVVAWVLLVIEDYYENKLQTVRNPNAYMFLLRTMGYDDKTAQRESEDDRSAGKIQTITVNVIPPADES